MAGWSPCKRSAFIRKLRRLGFTPPEPGGRHFFVRYGNYTLTLPSSPEYSVPQLRILLREVAAGTGLKISAEDWARL